MSNEWWDQHAGHLAKVITSWLNKLDEDQTSWFVESVEVFPRDEDGNRFIVIRDEETGRRRRTIFAQGDENFKLAPGYSSHKNGEMVYLPEE